MKYFFFLIASLVFFPSVVFGQITSNPQCVGLNDIDCLQAGGDSCEYDSQARSCFIAPDRFNAHGIARSQDMDVLIQEINMQSEQSLGRLTDFFAQDHGNTVLQEYDQFTAGLLTAARALDDGAGVLLSDINSTISQFEAQISSRIGPYGFAYNSLLASKSHIEQGQQQIQAGIQEMQALFNEGRQEAQNSQNSSEQQADAPPNNNNGADSNGVQQQCFCSVSFEPSFLVNLAVTCTVTDLKLIAPLNSRVALSELYRSIPTAQCPDKDSIKNQFGSQIDMSASVSITESTCTQAIGQLTAMIPSELASISGSCQIVTGQQSNITTIPISGSGASTGGSASRSGGTQGGIAESDPGVVHLINPIGGSVDNPQGIVNIRTILGNVLKQVTGIIGSLAFVGFVLGGFYWMTSQGNPEKVKLGLNSMIFSAIGLFVILASYAILTTILTSIGVSEGSTTPITTDGTTVGDESCKSTPGGQWECVSIDNDACGIVAPYGADIAAKRDLCNTNSQSCRLNKCQGTFNAQDVVCCNVNPGAQTAGELPAPSATQCDDVYKSYALSCNSFSFGCRQNKDSSDIVAIAYEAQKKGTKPAARGDDSYRIKGMCSGSDFCCLPNPTVNPNGKNSCEKAYGGTIGPRNGNLMCGTISGAEPTCETNQAAIDIITDLYNTVGIGSRLVGGGKAISGLCPAREVCCMPKI